MMKYLRLFFAILMVCSLCGCSAKDNIKENTETEINEDVSQMEDSEAIKDSAMKINLEPVAFDLEQIKSENNFSISFESREEKIVLFDTVLEKELVSFEESYGSEGGMFLSMIDENNGAFLYCSTPACGMMMKQMYVTKDRWQSYDQMDISLLIDGYPTSLSALSDNHLYIGAQLHGDGYLFESTDGGKNWNPVIIDDEIKCKDGYAPIFNNEEGVSYVLLKYDDLCSLYQSDAALSEWKRVGAFLSKMKIESYFIWDGKVIIIVTDMQGQYYQLSLDKMLV